MGVMADMVYATGLALGSPLLAYRMLRKGKWRTDWAGRMGHCTARPDGRPTLLIHGVSVGEINAIRLLVERIEAAESGQWKLVISSTTDTGIARARSLFEPRHQVVRYPLDFSRAVGRFLDAVKPDLVALVELEVWPNFTEACVRRGIGVCVINGRLSERSFRGYRRIRPLVARMFARLTSVAAQNRAIADRFIALGAAADRVEVLDTMKWDTAEVADEVAGSDALCRAMGIDRARPIIVAGSTGPGEEKLLIEQCPPEAQLLLVPRKPERFDEVAALVPDIVRRSACPDGSARPLDGRRLFLLDTMGELRKAYALADVVIVGRSLLGLYGSDMMEPIALGKPTIIGPHYGDFAHIMEALIAGEGIIVTDKPGVVAASLLADIHAARALAQRGRDVILSHQGSTDRHVKLLIRLMPQSKRA